jgi:hypothetical protein
MSILARSLRASETRPEIRVQSVLLVIGVDRHWLLKEESRYGLLCI